MTHPEVRVSGRWKESTLESRRLLQQQKYTDIRHKTESQADLDLLQTPPLLHDEINQKYAHR